MARKKKDENCINYLCESRKNCATFDEEYVRANIDKIKKFYGSSVFYRKTCHRYSKKEK